MPTEAIFCDICGGFVTTPPKGEYFNCEYCGQLNRITGNGTVAIFLPEPITPAETQPETPAPKKEEVKTPVNTLKSNAFGHFIAGVFLIAIFANMLFGTIWTFAATVAIFIAVFTGLGADDVPAKSVSEDDPDFGGVVWALTMIIVPVLMPFLCWNVASGFFINLIGGIGFGIAIITVGTLAGLFLQTLRK